MNFEALVTIIKRDCLIRKDFMHLSQLEKIVCQYLTWKTFDGITLNSYQAVLCYLFTTYKEEVKTQRDREVKKLFSILNFFSFLIKFSFHLDVQRK